jgi:SAM-dependent methyltransferase
MTEDPVQAQYEAYPYPERDPADEANRLITGSPSHLDELNHYVFGGSLDVARPLEVLVAGGGTGDALIMLAQQLADRGSPARVTYVDLSKASRAIAEARARVRGLSNIRFLELSLLEVPASGLGPFDYIDCCGVLHHLEDPAAGLHALVQVLAPEGGLGLMLYGELGRTGVYPMQEMLRRLGHKAGSEERLKLARHLLLQLPPTNWLRRNPLVQDHLRHGDAGLFDLFLHARDRAFRVPELARLCAAGGLRIVQFIEPAFYDPASYLNDPDLLDRLRDLDRLDRAAFAELLSGALRKHVFYAVRRDNPVAPPDPADRTAVPVLRDLDGQTFARSHRPGAVLSANVDGFSFRLALPNLAGPFLHRVDGTRTVGDLVAQVASAAETGTEEGPVLDVFVRLFGAFNSLGKMYLRRPSADRPKA